MSPQSKRRVDIRWNRSGSTHVARGGLPETQLINAPLKLVQGRISLLLGALDAPRAHFRIKLYGIEQRGSESALYKSAGTRVQGVYRKKMWVMVRLTAGGGFAGLALNYLQYRFKTKV